MNENILEEIKLLKDRVTKLESKNRDAEYKQIMTEKEKEENIFTKKHSWNRKEKK